MKTWKNGEKGKVVKQIIDENFSTLETSITQMKKTYIKDFTSSDWSSGVIFIQYSEYVKSHPIVELYAKHNGKYSSVFGGYRITDSGIELLSDINYEGRVIIR